MDLPSYSITDPQDLKCWIVEYEAILKLPNNANVKADVKVSLDYFKDRLKVAEAIEEAEGEGELV